MQILIRALLLLFLVSGISFPALSQLFNLNPPTITGQRPTPLFTEKNTPVTIAFENLRVSDPDIFVPPYPEGYTLQVFPGTDYSLSNATVTPDNNFVGTLTVKVQVNDGKFDSNIFDLKIDVTNIKPVITGQEPISIKEGSNFTILLSHLKVKDDDNKYPDDFSLHVFSGSNYSVVGTTITPVAGFTGKLKVLVSVNDGDEESDEYEFNIDVKANIVPVIKGQVALSTNRGKEIELALGHLSVVDGDNAYPADFTLNVYAGSHYSLNGNIIKPNANFTGTLKVPVTVHDGLDESKIFDVKIEVLPIDNTPPMITGQDPLITNEDKNITVTLANLRVSDPDNTYPDDFELKIPQGSGAYYSASGNVITPFPNFNGALEVQITVSDGLDDSKPFPLSIVVTPVNDPPVITGQEEIHIRSGRPTAIQVSSLLVNDPDTANTSGFTLRILPGTNYTSNGNVITPTINTGRLTVKVVVNDGVVDSAPYNLKVDVVPGGSRPLITGQQSIVMNEDASLTLKLDDLFVTDDDDNYPIGFSLSVHPGSHYTVQGLTITPEVNLNGLITVTITVSDGKETSDPFPLKIYIIPVNDAPTITRLETTPMDYEPGSGPMQITTEFAGDDIDNLYLSFAEVGIGDSTFNPVHDELVFENTDQIRGVYDHTKGILSLIGQSSLKKYDSAIRSIKYNYLLTLDESGKQTEVLPGKKKIYFTLSDGQLTSERQKRTISIETPVELDIPNTFTPNGDRANDTWRVRPVADASRFDKALIKVYNKRGLLIYESKGFEKSWDGSFNGEILPVDTYYYTIDLNLSYAKKTYKGTVMILR